MSKDMPLSLRPEVLQGYNERMNDSTFLQEGSCPLQRLQFIGKWLFFFFFFVFVLVTNPVSTHPHR